MKFCTKVSQLTFISLLLCNMMGCGEMLKLDLVSSQGTPINELLQEYELQENVQISGQVKRVVPLIDSAAYQVEDQTGTIWIVTEGSLPEIGSTVVVEGTLQYQSIPIEQKDLGEIYLLETNQEVTEEP